MKLLEDQPTEGLIEQAALDQWLQRDKALRQAVAEGVLSVPQYLWAVWADETQDN